MQAVLGGVETGLNGMQAVLGGVEAYTGDDVGPVVRGRRPKLDSCTLKFKSIVL